VSLLTHSLARRAQPVTPTDQGQRPRLSHLDGFPSRGQRRRRFPLGFGRPVCPVIAPPALTGVEHAAKPSPLGQDSVGFCSREASMRNTRLEGRMPEHPYDYWVFASHHFSPFPVPSHPLALWTRDGALQDPSHVRVTGPQAPQVSRASRRAPHLSRWRPSRRLHTGFRLAPPVAALIR